MKVIRYNTWKELLRAVKYYCKLGIRCEVRGWEDMRFNKLTIFEEVENE